MSRLRRWWNDKDRAYRHIVIALFVLKVLILVTILVLLYIVLYR